MSKKDGGQAFPFPGSQQLVGNIRTTIQPEGGMTLRDYFAAEVLGGLSASQSGRNPRFEPKDDAEYCYKVADAMLEERKK